MNKQLEESKQLTEQKEWHPTPHMQLWLDKSIELMTDNISEIERESKITAQSYYGWLKSPDFRSWYKTEWDERMKSLTPVLDSIGLKYAKKGSFQHLEMMQKRAGALNGINTNVAVQVNTFIKKEKDEFGI